MFKVKKECKKLVIILVRFNVIKTDQVPEHFLELPVRLTGITTHIQAVSKIN